MLHLRLDKRRSRRCVDRTRLVRHPRAHDIDALFPGEEHFLTTHVVPYDTTVASKKHCVAAVTDFADRIQWLSHSSYLTALTCFSPSVGDLIASISMTGALRICQRNVLGEVQWCHTFSSSRVHYGRDGDPSFRVIDMVDVRAVVRTQEIQVLGLIVDEVTGILMKANEFVLPFVRPFRPCSSTTTKVGLGQDKPLNNALTLGIESSTVSSSSLHSVEKSKGVVRLHRQNVQAPMQGNVGWDCIFGRSPSSNVEK